MKWKKLRLNLAGLTLAGLGAACSGGDINVSTEGPGIPGLPPGDPGTVQFRETSFDATEGTVVNIIVTRSSGSSGIARVDYTTVDGTAVGGSDYETGSGTLSWPDGWFGNRTISIRLSDDDAAEPAESFTVTLSNASSATLGVNTSATVNIIDNDTAALKATGKITALNDVTVNDIRYDTSTANVTVNGLPAIVSDLRPGQVVTLEGDVNFSNATGSADTISYIAMLIGPVEKIDTKPDQLIVMGQTVLTNADTVLDLSNVAELSEGDIVEVSGFADAVGNIHATRVDWDGTIAKHQLVGTVAGLDLANLSFAVNSLTLDYSSAILVDLPGGAPINGMTVKAIGTMYRGIFVAEQLVGVPGLAGDPGEKVQTAGLMTLYKSPTDFEIGGNVFSITAETIFLNGDTNDLSSTTEMMVGGEFAADQLIAAKWITFGRHIDQEQMADDARSVVGYQGGIIDQ
jgi:hypothetical protein